MTGPSPAVTVIIPTYNSSRTLRLSVESVLLQTLTDFELWVVGDGCTDDTASVMAEFSDARLKWMNLTRNSGGPCLPRNEGWQRARGRFIAYLGHDDLWFPWHLEKLVKYIEASDAAFVYSLGVVLGPKGLVSGLYLPGSHKHISGLLSPSHWLHRRDLETSVGRWSTKIPFGDDLEFIRRIQRARLPMVFCRELSVLKYPAGLWKLYEPCSSLPQERGLRRIREDPPGFREEILLDLAALASRDPFFGTFSPAGQRPSILRSPARALMSLYGYHRWPVSRLLRWHYRRETGLKKSQ